MSLATCTTAPLLLACGFLGAASVGAATLSNDGRVYAEGIGQADTEADAALAARDRAIADIVGYRFGVTVEQQVEQVSRNLVTAGLSVESSSTYAERITSRTRRITLWGVEEVSPGSVPPDVPQTPQATRPSKGHLSQRYYRIREALLEVQRRALIDAEARQALLCVPLLSHLERVTLRIGNADSPGGAVLVTEKLRGSIRPSAVDAKLDLDLRVEEAPAAGQSRASANVTTTMTLSRGEGPPCVERMQRELGPLEVSTDTMEKTRIMAAALAGATTDGIADWIARSTLWVIPADTPVVSADLTTLSRLMECHGMPTRIAHDSLLAFAPWDTREVREALESVGSLLPSDDADRRFILRQDRGALQRMRDESLAGLRWTVAHSVDPFTTWNDYLGERPITVETRPGARVRFAFRYPASGYLSRAPSEPLGIGPVTVTAGEDGIARCFVRKVVVLGRSIPLVATVSVEAGRRYCPADDGIEMSLSSRLCGGGRMQIAPMLDGSAEQQIRAEGQLVKCTVRLADTGYLSMFTMDAGGRLLYRATFNIRGPAATQLWRVRAVGDGWWEMGFGDSWSLNRQSGPGIESVLFIKTDRELSFAPNSYVDADALRAQLPPDAACGFVSYEIR